MKSNIQIMQVDNGWLVRSHSADEEEAYFATTVFQSHDKHSFVSEVVADVMEALEKNTMINVEINITPIDKMVFGKENEEAIH